MMVLMMMRCEMVSWNILKASQPASCRLCQLSICHTLTILRLEAIYGMLLCITNTALHGSEKKHCEVLLCAVGIVGTPSSVQPVVGGGCTRQCRSQLAVKLRQLSMFGHHPSHCVHHQHHHPGHYALTSMSDKTKVDFEQTAEGTQPSASSTMPTDLTRGKQTIFHLNIIIGDSPS